MRITSTLEISPPSEGRIEDGYVRIRDQAEADALLARTRRNEAAMSALRRLLSLSEPDVRGRDDHYVISRISAQLVSGQLMVRDSRAPAGRAAARATPRLLIADGSFREVDAFARFVLGMSDTERRGIVRVQTWDEFRAALQRQTRIDELIIYTHGMPGGLILQNHGRPFNTLSTFLTGMPTASRVRVEGCNVGRDPRGMAHFGRILGARTVEAFTYFHMSQQVEITVPRGGTTEDLVRQGLGRWTQYLMPNQLTFAQIAQRAGRQVLYAEWYRQDDVLDPPPERRPGELSRRVHFTRASAQEASYTSNQADLPGESNAPVIAFQHVTVTMAGTASATP